MISKDNLREAYRDVKDNIWLDGIATPYELDECEGWVAKPIFKPELTGDK